MGQDRPDEAREFSRHGGDDVLCRFAARRQPRVATMQPLLGRPGARLRGLRGVVLPGAARPSALGRPIFGMPLLVTSQEFLLVISFPRD